MSRRHLLIGFCYLAFAWQAALRTEINWHGYSPNFLVLGLIGALWILNDATALVAVAILGLLSDSLAEGQLGNDTLCFLVVAGLIQATCPPRLLRHPALLLLLLLLATVLIEFSTISLRTTLAHGIGPAGNVSAQSLHWGLLALGNGLYTAVIAALPLFASHLWPGQAFQADRCSVGNHWHRLTS